MGHRLSVDLDYFSISKFNPERLQQRLNDEGFKLLDIEISWQTLKCSIKGVQVSFMFQKSKILKPFVEFESTDLSQSERYSSNEVTCCLFSGIEEGFRRH